MVALFDTRENQPYQKSIAHQRRYANSNRMADDVVVGKEDNALLPCHVASCVPVEARGSLSKVTPHTGSPLCASKH